MHPCRSSTSSVREGRPGRSSKSRPPTGDGRERGGARFHEQRKRTDADNGRRRFRQEDDAGWRPRGRDDPGSSAHTVPRLALAYRLLPSPSRRAVSLRVLSRDQLMNATGPKPTYIETASAGPRLPRCRRSHQRAASVRFSSSAPRTFLPVVVVARSSQHLQAFADVAIRSFAPLKWVVLTGVGAVSGRKREFMVFS